MKKKRNYKNIGVHLSILNKRYLKKFNIAGKKTEKRRKKKESM